MIESNNIENNKILIEFQKNSERLQSENIKLYFTSNLFLFFAILTTIISVYLIIAANDNFQNESRTIYEQYFIALKNMNDAKKTYLVNQKMLNSKRQILANFKNKSFDKSQHNKQSKFIEKIRQAYKPIGKGSLTQLYKQLEILKADSIKYASNFKREDIIYNKTSSVVNQTQKERNSNLFIFTYYLQRISIVVILEILTFFFLKSFKEIRKERELIINKLTGLNLKVIGYLLLLEKNDKCNSNSLVKYIFEKDSNNVNNFVSAEAKGTFTEIDPNKLIELLNKLIKQ
jgi:hypothetical protein